MNLHRYSPIERVTLVRRFGLQGGAFAVRYVPWATIHVPADLSQPTIVQVDVVRHTVTTDMVLYDGFLRLVRGPVKGLSEIDRSALIGLYNTGVTDMNINLAASLILQITLLGSVFFGSDAGARDLGVRRA